MPRGIIVPKSNQLGNAILGAQGLPLLDAEQIGGEETARATSRLGKVVSQIGLDLKAKEDTTVASAGLNAYEPLWQSDLSDLKTRRRGNGVLAGEDTDEDFITEGLRLRKERRDHAIGTMKNRAQREALTQAIDSRDRFAVSALRNHFDREIDTYERETDVNSTIMSAQTIATAESEEEIEEGIAGIETNIQKMKTRDKWSPSTVAVERLKFTSPPLVKSLETQAIVDPEGAEIRMRGYLKREKKILDTNQVKDLLITFEREGLAARAQAIAGEALALAVPGEGIEATVARGRNMSSGKEESEVVRIIAFTRRLRAADKAARNDESQRSLASQTRNIFTVSPDTRRRPEELVSLRAGLERRAFEEELSGEQINQLMNLFDEEAKEIPRQTIWAEYEDMKQNPSILLDESTLDLETKFVGAQLTEAFELKGKVERGELLNEQVVSDEISAEFVRLGWTTADNGQKMGEMRLLLEGDIIAAQKDGTIPRNERMGIYANRIALLYDPIGPLGPDLIRSNRDTIEKAVSKDQNVLALAVWQASSRGTRNATEAEIVGRYFLLRRDIDQAGTEADIAALQDQYQANGKAARRRLNDAGYQDTDLYNFDALVAQEQGERKAEARAARRAKERQERGDPPAAPKRNRRGSTVSGSPQFSGRDR